MTHLTEEEAHLLRATLGLSYWNRTEPQRNHLRPDAKHERVVDKLVERGFLVPAEIIGQGGKEVYYKATDAGRVVVLDARWRD